MGRYQVEIFLEPGKGRGLRTSRLGKGLEPGTLIITERPYCYVLLNGEEDNHCHYCLAEERKDQKLLICPGCTTAKYCNKECQKNAELDHKCECRGYRQLMLLPYHLRLIGRIIYRQHVRKLETGPLDPLNDLCSHMEDLTGSFGMDSQLGHLARMVDKDVVPNWAYFQRLFGKVTCNCFGISNSELKDIAVGVYPQAAMLNHSCRSNTIATFRGPNMEIRTFTHIGPGEEFLTGILLLAAIYVAKVGGAFAARTLQSDALRKVSDRHRNVSKVFHAYVQKGVTTDQRRDDLMEKYFFFCQCPDCMDLNRDLRMRTVKCPDCEGPVLPNPESKSVYEKCSRCEHDEFDEDFYDKIDTAVQYADNVVTKERRWCNGLEYEMQFRQNCLLEIDKVLHEDNVNTIRILVGAFHAAAGLGEWRQAVDWGLRLERGLNLYLQPNEPDQGNLHHKLGKAYFHLGDQEKGRFHALKAKEIYTITHGRRRPQVKMVKDLLREFDEVVSDDDEEEEKKDEGDKQSRNSKLPSDWNPADYKCWIDPRENKRNAEKEDPPRKRDYYREDVQVKREGDEFRSKLSSLLDNGASRKETSSPISYNSVDTARPSRVMCLRQEESDRRRSSSLDRYTANSRPASPRYTANSRPASPARYTASNRPASPARYTINTRPTSPATLALERARSLLNQIEFKTSTAGSLALSRAGRYDDRRYASLRIPSTSRRLQPAYMSISLSR